MQAHDAILNAMLSIKLNMMASVCAPPVTQPPKNATMPRIATRGRTGAHAEDIAQGSFASHGLLPRGPVC